MITNIINKIYSNNKNSNCYNNKNNKFHHKVKHLRNYNIKFDKVERNIYLK